MQKLYIQGVKFASHFRPEQRDVTQFSQIEGIMPLIRHPAITIALGRALGVCGKQRTPRVSRLERYTN